MKKWVLIGAAALLASCNSAEAPVENDAMNEIMPADENAAAMNVPADSNALAAAPGMSHLNTTWEWTEEGKAMVLSVDSSGAYIIEADGKHLDHGTYAVKDGKDCFTSAMGEKKTDCWTPIAETAIGQSVESKSDAGMSGSFKRVEYRALKMPG